MPNPNGKRHASEIASLALDMLEHVNRMEIPHIPGTNVRLRIGCHSGRFPCLHLFSKFSVNISVYCHENGCKQNI